MRATCSFVRQTGKLVQRCGPVVNCTGVGASNGAPTPLTNCTRAYALARSYSMAGFKFNFTLPDSDWSEDCNPEARSLTETCYSLKSAPISQPSLHRGCHKLNEVLLQPFHEQLLSVISPIKYPVKLTQSSPLSPPSLPPPTLPPSLPQSHMCENVTLHYITSDQLQSLLDKERRKDSVEQVLNLKSDTDVEFEMIAQLSSELGPLLSVANSVHSDLIPGIYEGGMKIWECAHDLIEYLATESAISLCGRRVLELGCGVGLPEIFALLCGAECAHFQDFNRELHDHS